MVWSADANIWVQRLTEDLPAGKALDIAGDGHDLENLTGGYGGPTEPRVAVSPP